MMKSALRASAMLALVAVAAAACTSSGSPGAAPTGASSAPSASSIPSTPPATSGKPPAVSGTAYFLGAKGDRVRIDAFSGGHVKVAVTLPTDTTPCTRNSVQISPDAKHIAWVKGDTPDGDRGKLMLADLDGSHAKTLDDNVLCIGAQAIRWPSGGELLQATTSAGGFDMFFTATGKRSESDPGDLKSAVWSVDGNAYAAFNGANDDQLFTDVTQPSHVYQTAYQPPDDQAANYDGFEPRSVSHDGRFVAVGWVNTDPSRADDSFAIIDASRGDPVRLPVAQITHAEFLSDQSVMVETAGSPRRLDTLDPALRLIASSPIPASLAKEILIRCIP